MVDRHTFITKLIKEIEDNTKANVEVPMPTLVKVLFDGKSVNEYDLVEGLVNLKKEYDLDYVVALPRSWERTPPMVRFWKTTKTTALPEVINENIDDNGSNEQR